MVNKESRGSTLESLKKELTRKRNFLNELSDRLKEQENDSTDLMQIAGTIQSVILEIGQLEIKIKYTARELKFY
jgi:hypothetical protein